MSETKLQPCRRKGEHCACFEQGQQCCECGWSRPVTSDPRITSADEMAKAVTEAVDAYDSGDEPNWKGLVHALRAALAAYNATSPLTGQEEDRG